MILRKLIFLLVSISLLASTLGYSQSQATKVLGFQLNPRLKRAVIPFEMHNNLVVISVILNNTIPMKFILDTGVRNAILTEKALAEFLNLEFSRKYTLSAPGYDGLIEAYVANDIQLGLTGVTGEGHSLLVLEEDYLQLKNYLGVQVHGILGYELFSRFIVDIDYLRRTITLEKPETWRAPRQMVSLEMMVQDTKPYIRVPVHLENGVVLNARLLVDSGASHGLLLDPQSSDTIQIPAKNFACSIGRGLGGDIKGRVAKIPGVKVSGDFLANCIVNFPDDYHMIDSLKGGSSTFRHGSIGGEILSRYRTIFDFSHQKLYLSKKPNTRREFYFNLSGLTVKARGSSLNVFEIIEVLEGSPAALAGAQTGDILIRINGLETQYESLKNINNMLNSKPGKKIRLVVSRHRSLHHLEFLLKDAI